MLSAGWAASIKLRNSVIELGSFFFEPLQLDLQPADLLVKVIQQGLTILPLAIISFRKDKLDIGQKLPLPLAHQVAMHGVLARQLADRLVSSNCCQRHLRLERRIITLTTPSFRHLRILSETELRASILHLNRAPSFPRPAHPDAIGGTFRIPGGFWNTFDFRNAEVEEPSYEIRIPMRFYPAGIAKYNFIVPQAILLDCQYIEEAMSKLFETKAWRRIRGPESKWFS